MKKYLHFLILTGVVLICPGFCRLTFAEAPKKLYGTWGLEKVQGDALCRELIKDIYYSFSADGTYGIWAKMLRPNGIKLEKAKGTFRVEGAKIHGKVSGVNIGPFPFRFEKTNSGTELLIITEINPACDIFLRRSDFEW